MSILSAPTLDFTATLILYGFDVIIPLEFDVNRNYVVMHNAIMCEFLPLNFDIKATIGTTWCGEIFGSEFVHHLINHFLFRIG